MSSNAKRLKDQLNRIQGASSVRLQGEMISSLISSVNQFVQQLVEEEKLVDQMKQLTKQVHSNPQTDTEKAEVREATELLSEANKVEGDISKKRGVLRQLDRDVSALKQAIKKSAIIYLCTHTA